MSIQYEGHGTTFTRSGLTLNPQKITLFGFSKEEIDVTTLANVAAKTTVLGALYATSNIVLNLEFDSAQHLAIISSGNASTKITFEDTSYITVWADVLEVGEAEFENDNKVTYDVTLKVTNLNAAGAETVPTYTAPA